MDWLYLMIRLVRFQLLTRLQNMQVYKWNNNWKCIRSSRTKENREGKQRREEDIASAIDKSIVIENKKRYIFYFFSFELLMFPSISSPYPYLILNMSLLIQTGPGRRWRHSMVVGTKCSTYNATTKQWCVALALWCHFNRENNWDKFETGVI